MQLPEVKRLGIQVLLQAVSPQFASIPRLPAAAEGCVNIEASSIDIDLPYSQFSRHQKSLFLVTGPDRAGQSVYCVIGDTYGVILIPVGDNA